AQYQKWEHFEQSLSMKVDSKDEDLKKLETASGMLAAPGSCVGRSVMEMQGVYPSLAPLSAKRINDIFLEYSSSRDVVVPSLRKASGAPNATGPNSPHSPKRQKTASVATTPITQPRTSGVPQSASLQEKQANVDKALGWLPEPQHQKQQRQVLSKQHVAPESATNSSAVVYTSPRVEGSSNKTPTPQHKQLLSHPKPPVTPTSIAPKSTPVPKPQPPANHSTSVQHGPPVGKAVPVQHSISAKQGPAVQKPTPVQRPAPAQQNLSAQHPTPVQRPPSVQQSSPAKHPTPVQQSSPMQRTTPAQRPAPVQQSSPMQRTTPAQPQRPAPAQQSPPVQRTTPAQRPAPAQQSPPVQRTTPAQRPAPAQQSPPVQRTTPAQRPAPAQQSPPASRTTPIQRPPSAQKGTPVQRPTSVQRPTPVQHNSPAQHPAPVQQSLSAQHPAPVQQSLSAQHPAPVQQSLSSHYPAPAQQSLSTQRPTPVQQNPLGQSAISTQTGIPALNSMPVRQASSMQSPVQNTAPVQQAPSVQRATTAQNIALTQKVASPQQSSSGQKAMPTQTSQLQAHHSAPIQTAMHNTIPARPAQPAQPSHKVQPPAQRITQTQRPPLTTPKAVSPTQQAAAHTPVLQTIPPQNPTPVQRTVAAQSASPAAAQNALPAQKTMPIHNATSDVIVLSSRESTPGCEGPPAPQIAVAAQNAPQRQPLGTGQLSQQESAEYPLGLARHASSCVESLNGLIAITRVLISSGFRPPVSLMPVLNVAMHESLKCLGGPLDSAQQPH
ncbi:hypothetical protein H4R24_003182, partial [Coemansia sp. RSA 988]